MSLATRDYIYMACDLASVLYQQVTLVVPPLPEDPDCHGYTQQRGGRRGIKLGSSSLYGPCYLTSKFKL